MPNRLVLVGSALLAAAATLMPGTASAAGELVVTVRDHGSGIAPRVDSPGLGVGLP